MAQNSPPFLDFDSRLEVIFLIGSKYFPIESDVTTPMRCSGGHNLIEHHHKD